MDLNKLQGLWILSQGLTSEEHVKRAYGVAKARPDLDLCAILLMSNLIPQDQADQARAASLKEAGNVESGEIQETVVGSNRAPKDQAANSQDALTQLLGLSSGQTFRHYALESELSRGAMGVVFRARDEERVLALKFMLTHNPDPAELKRFIREAETLVRLKHPNIVEIYDFGSDKDQCFLAMELIGGSDLSELVKEQLHSGSQGLSVEDALTHLTPIIGALTYCHEQNILHRDLKPQNILVEPLSGTGTRPVLVDFGLMKKMPGEEGGSQSSASSAASLTNAGEMVGTPAFMAPEQFRPDAEFGKMGPWTDVWGWGATLYFVLTGSPPYNKASVLEIFQAIVGDETPRMSKVRDDIPSWLDDLAVRCLQKESSDRPSFEEIQQILDGTDSETAKHWFPLLPIGLTLVLIVLLSLGFFLFESTTELTSSIPWPKETAKAKLTFQGRINNKNIPLRIGRIESQSDEAGQFKVAVELLQGMNDVTLEVFTNGAWNALEKRQVYCDTKPPTLELRSEKSKNGFVFIDGERTLQLLIDDKSPPFSIVFDDFQLKTKDPFIELNQLAHSNPEIVARVSDRLGNSRMQQLRVVTDQGLETFRKALSGLDSWQSTPTVIQDGVFDWVDRQLGDAYEFIGARVYRCGSFCYRIASYLHRRTGVEFQLIPGHEFRETQWSHPDNAYEYLLMDVMSRTDSGVEVIADGLYDGGLEKYQKQILPLFRVQEDDSFEDCLKKVQGNREKIPLLKEKLIGWKSQLKEKKVVKTTVRIIKPMLVGRFELSQKQWNKVVSVGARVKETKPNWPMTNVSFLLVKQWLKRVGDGFRLPRPFEWQYACRGGSRGPFFWGDDLKKAEDYCWVYENSDGELHSIKEHSRQSNAFGLSDMLGNVSEWSEVSWNNWSETLRREIEQGRFPQRYSSDLKDLAEWRSTQIQMGSRCDWYKSWARADFFYWEDADDPSTREGFRVFVTLPLDK
ncbi:MAG: bifunctional serine/threonine-protein kinase/formylglycine-generating enzyme family protein [Planctomycetota bacterium]|nr:bifunctional serine/threonine-protein kinase/formylglycine-generating enzyme family protein [Planctomycetota bacterium]